MGYSFDGDARIITLTAGTTDVSIVDLWSRWVDWCAASGNSAFLKAIRFVGGDAISATKKLGVTFFLVNGWRIRPQEASHRLTIAGNLYTDPAGSSPFIATLGNYNVTIEMSVSNLSDSTVAQMSQINAGVYRGMVALDIGGAAGTAFPLGTGAHPLNNLADAKTVAQALGIKTLSVNGAWTFGAADNLDGYHIKAVTHEAATITLTAGCSTAGTVFEDVVITGTQGGDAHLLHCNIPLSGLYGAEGEHISCTYRGDVSTATNADLEILDSWSAMSGVNHPELICNGTVKVGVRNYSGGMGVVGLTAGSVTFGINTGNVHVHNTCTGGTVTARGVGSFIDESTGTAVIRDGFVNAVDLKDATAAAVWQHATGAAMAVRLAEAWGRLGLDPSKPLVTGQTQISFGDIVMAMTGDATQTTVTRAP